MELQVGELSSILHSSTLVELPSNIVRVVLSALSRVVQSRVEVRVSRCGSLLGSHGLWVGGHND